MWDLDKIDFIRFAGGELHIKGNNFSSGHTLDDQYELYAPLRSSEDIMKLILFTDAYKRFYGCMPRLYIPYIPYARQDRVANSGESLSIKVFCDMVNAQQYPSVSVFDPHSDVCMALLDRVCTIRDVDDSFLSRYIKNYANKIVVAPDAGAYKKLCKVIPSNKLVYATKQRDTETGKLSHMEIHSSIDLNEKELLVVDDICDGGGTFILLSQAIKEKFKPKSMQLYVSHGIFSKGLSILTPFYDKVYTTDSFFIQDTYQNIDPNYLEVISLRKIIEPYIDEYYLNHAL